MLSDQKQKRKRIKKSAFLWFLYLTELLNLTYQYLTTFHLCANHPTTLYCFRTF